MDNVKRESFRQRLLKYFGMVIIILTVSSGFNLFQSFRVNQRYNTMFRKLFITSSLTIKMGNVHQNLKNYINYENEDILPEFKKSLDEFVSGFEHAQQEIIGPVLTTENQSLFYKFADIKKMVNDYSNSSLALVKDADFVNQKFNIFDSYYELEKLKDFIYLSQTDLIFRQMVQMEKFYETNRIYNRRVLMLLVFFFVSLVFLSLSASVRFSRTLTGPLCQMVEQAEKAAGGVLETIKINVATSGEIYILMKAFNKMVEEIKIQIEELKQKAQLEKQLRKEEVKSLKMENALNRSELLYLQSQMNPHFLFNTINIISAIADMEEAEQTREMLDSMTVMLRYNLKHSGTNTLIREEIHVINNYMSIQKKRFGDRIKFETDIDKSCLDWSIPTMILQPLVENSVIHGLESKEEDGLLTLSVVKEKDITVITIRDNGSGISKEILEGINGGTLSEEKDGRKHLGIMNVIRRLELSYHRKCLIFSSIENVGTEVRIELPFSLI